MSRKITSKAFCYIGVLVIAAGCGVTESVVAQTPAQTVAAAATPRPAPARNERLIPGLDGASYEPYRAATVQRIQQALAVRGLYKGPVHGVLDTPTMEAIYAFQKAHYGLQVSGIPTPRTRKILEQGSHTDPVL